MKTTKTPLNNAARILPVYSSDTAGVCSVLFELGGLTVVHDASGCNSTYSTHDEPRWYDTESMVYITGLTEMEAVLGGDARFLDSVSDAASRLRPAFIAICGSPMPAMIGTDFEGLARELEARCGVPVLAPRTNGIRSYLHGAGEALAALIDRFCPGRPKTREPSCNLLGATPLDFGVNGTIEAIRAWAEAAGFRVLSCMAMGSTLAEIAEAAGAHVNLVLSAAGLPAARLLHERFDTPYVVGVPFGRFGHDFAEDLAEALREAAFVGDCSVPCGRRTGQGMSDSLLIVGEAVGAASLSCALERETGLLARVLAPIDGPALPKWVLVPGDRAGENEDLTAELFEWALEVIADPLYRPLCPASVPFTPLPHVAFSGRCFLKDMPVLTGRPLADWLREACGI